MATVNDVLTQVLDLSDREFFNLTDDVLTARELSLLDLDFIGIAVNAPAVVDILAQEKAPLVLATRFDGERDWRYPLRDNCILAATDLSTGEVYFVSALKSEKELESRGGRYPESPEPRPDPDSLAGIGVQLAEIDMNARLPFSDNRAWAVNILYFDWPSNTVNLSVSAPPVETETDTARQAGAHPLPADAPGLPSYLAQSQTPNLGPQDRLVFSMDNPSNNPGSLVFRGAFRVKMKAFYRPDSPVKLRDQGAEHQQIAGVPLTLVILKQGEITPLQLDMQIPIYQSNNPSGAVDGQAITGFFAIDARQQATFALGSGHYAAYFYLDGRAFGPVVFSV
ncbi:MAG: hypothetical protein MI864_24235 [Pseudomonadales bacterium]|nr:hypothetical protein [Pseudomonadales bacterium]